MNNNWASDIRDGVLCYVWNDGQANPNKKIMVVKSIDPNTGMFNDGWSCVYYKYAEPIPLDYIKQYCIE
jgi:hypothetical protein